jgi:hypothetical protein
VHESTEEVTRYRLALEEVCDELRPSLTAAVNRRVIRAAAGQLVMCSSSRAVLVDPVEHVTPRLRGRPGSREERSPAELRCPVAKPTGRRPDAAVVVGPAVDRTTTGALADLDTAARELREALERELPSGGGLDAWPGAALTLIELQTENVRRALDALHQVHVTATEEAEIEREDGERRAEYAANRPYAVTRKQLNELYRQGVADTILDEAISCG